MNERIRELAIKAGLYVDVNGQPWPRNMNGEDIEGTYQKFAELIVRECAQIGEDVDGNQTTKNEILKHFGVEE